MENVNSGNDDEIGLFGLQHQVEIFVSREVCAGFGNKGLGTTGVDVIDTADLGNILIAFQHGVAEHIERTLARTGKNILFHKKSAFLNSV